MCAAEASSRKIGTRQIRTLKVGAPQAGAPKIHPPQGRSLHEGAVKVPTLEVEAIQC